METRFVLYKLIVSRFPRRNCQLCCKCCYDDDTLKQGLQRMSVAWPYGLEWWVGEGGGEGVMTPFKKNLLHCSVLLKSRSCGKPHCRATVHGITHGPEREEMIKLACAVLNS